MMNRFNVAVIAGCVASGLLSFNPALAEPKTTVKFPPYFMPEGCRLEIGTLCKRRDGNRSSIKGDTDHHTGLDKDVLKASGDTKFEHECDGYRYQVTNIGGNNWEVKALPMITQY